MRLKAMAMHSVRYTVPQHFSDMSTSKNSFNNPTTAGTHFKITVVSKGRTFEFINKK
jgi:hypothetical protein